MRTDNINSLSDFQAVRDQITSEIDLTEQKIELDVTKLKYQVMPGNMIKSVWERLGNRVLDWVDQRLGK